MMADVFDPKYEYDAPGYVDFATVALDQVEDDEADKWFDNRLEDDLVFDDSFNPRAQRTVPLTTVEPKSPEEAKPKVKVEVASSLESTLPSNNPSSQQAPSVTVKTEPVSPLNTVKEEEQSGTDVKPSIEHTDASVKVEGGTGGQAGEVKLGKRSTSERVNEFMACMTRVKEESDGDAPKVSVKVEDGVEKAPKPKRGRRSERDASHRATSNIHRIMKKPRTPRRPLEQARVTEAKPHQDKPKKTTEELQLEEVKRLQNEAKKTLQQSRRSFQRLVKTSGPVVVKGSKPTTQAVEFNFHTKDRDRSRPGSAAKREGGVNPTNFPQTLRNFNSADNFNPNFNIGKKPPTPTYLKTKPFKFHLDERFKSKPGPSTSNEVVPVAEAIEKYQKATPPRFRSNPGSVTKKWKAKANTSGHSTASSSSGNSDDTGTSFSNKLTVPNTPNLLTKGRSRPVTVKSATEEEEEVVAQMKEYQFKAKPFDRDIFLKGGLHGVPRKTEEVHLTDPHTPPLATKERSLKRKAEETSETSEEEEQTAFHAQPMPNFEKITGVPAKRLMPITEPESPALALKRRRLNASHQSEQEQEEKEETDGHVIRANPMPDMAKVFQPKLPHKKVETQPFSFEERDKNKPTRETFVEMILRKEKRPEFKAQPLPNFGLLPDLPLKAPPHLTQPKPFSLHTDIRGEVHGAKLQEKVEKETKRMKEDVEFKANPASVLQKEPFVPLKVVRPLLTVNNVVLHSEVRSEQRAKFDAKRMREEYEKMTENLQRRALRAKEESKELTEYRKQLVHKAQPVHHYAPIVIRPSERPFTQPISPHFHTDDRLRSKQEQ